MGKSFENEEWKKRIGENIKKNKGKYGNDAGAVHSKNLSLEKGIKEK